MILADDIATIGHVTKTHGIDGEMSVMIDDDIQPENLSCLIFDMDGLYVPFFISSSRRRGTDSWLIRLQGINSELSASEFVGKGICARVCEIPEDEADGLYLEDFVGYRLLDIDGSEVGLITEVDFSTENTLFLVNTADGRQCIVPASIDLMTDISTDNATITMNLPSGILDLN